MLMKKDLFNLRLRSRWLLISLLALLAGASPAWASITDNGDGTVTEGFDGSSKTYTSGAWVLTLPTGWDYSGSASTWSIETSNDGIFKTKPSIYSYSTSNASNYLITPELQGDFSFWMRSYNYSYGSSIIAYECTYENDVLTVGNKIGEITIAKTKPVAAIAKKTISYSGSGRVALLINYAYFDDFTYTPFVDNSAIDKPKAFTASNVTYNSAQLSWTAGGTETAWQLLYSSDANFDKDNATPIDITDNPYTISGLTPETSYNAYIRAKSGEDVSSWVSVSFTTLEKYAKPTGLSVAKQGTNATLTWTAGGTESAWDVVYSTNSAANPDELSTTTVNAATHTLTDLTVGTTYYVWVRASHGSEGSGWINTSFTLAYSTPAPTSVDGNGITNVTFGTGAEVVNYNTSNTPRYQDNSAQLGAVTAGSETTVAITFSTGYTYGTVVWVDWNQNYEFEDSEIVFAGECTSDKPNTLNATFTVPAEQSAGNYRMRICAGDTYYDSHKTMATAAGANPTPTGSYCVAQDYTLKVKEAAAYAMSVSDTDIAFGTVKNTTTTKTFTIINDGDNTLENVSVVSSDNEIFTVSETGFDIPAESSKVITVTFVKGVAGDYSETITVSQANVDNKVINVTATYEAPAAATMAVTLDEAAVDGTVAFGSVGKAIEKTFTIANNGEVTLNISSIVSSNTSNFTVSPATLTVAGGSSETFTVTFVYDAENLGAEKTADITITPSNEGLVAKTFTVSATSIEQWSEDFTTDETPTGWVNPVSGYATWTFSNGVAYGAYSYGLYQNARMQSPLLTIESEKSLTFKAKGTSNMSELKVYAYTSAGVLAKTFNFDSEVEASTSDFTTLTISNLDEGNYKLVFDSYNTYIKEISGFKLCVNDPTLFVSSDAAGNNEVTSGTPKDFGWANTAQSAVYYIKNTGTGTLTINSISNVEGFTATTANDAMTVAANADPLALTITMTNDSEGAKSGTFTITTDGGTFTIPVSGYVIGSKNFVDFTANEATIPAGWKAGSWTVTDGAAISTSSSTMATRSFTVGAGENLLVDIKGNSGNATKTFAYSYSTDNGTSWSDANTLLEASGYGIIQDQVLTISDIADAEQERTVLIRFTGQNLGIKHIYGFTAVNEAIMTTTAADIAFGMQTAESAEQTFIISNEGNATLEGLSVTLGKTDAAAEYEIRMTKDDAAFTGTTLAAGESITVYVKQLYDIDNCGSKSDVLTIAATGQTPVAINLSGATRDVSKLYVDFESGMPDGWTKNSWYIDAKAARAGYNASSLITTPLTVTENETLSFSAYRTSIGTTPTLKIRYTTNGGVTWSEYVDYSSQITSTTPITLELNNVPAGTVVVDFYGRYVYLDNIYGFVNTTAPMLALTTEETLTEDKYDFGQTLQAAPADKVFTITNNGNGNLVSTIAATDDVTAALATTDGELSNENKTVTLEPGETATITVSLNFNADAPGVKSGRVTIDSNDPVADVTLNFTANVLDATALNEELASLPAGWYNDGWTVDGTAHVYTGVDKEIITEKYGAEAGKNVLSFDAKLQSTYADGELKVYTSTDRQEWTLAKTVTLTAENQAVALDALTDGEYYVKFVSLNASIDNLAGLKKLTAPEHDLYVSATTFPTATLIPETENGVSASATVYSLRAAETGVYAKLFFDETEVATADAQDIAKDGNKTFNFTANVPAKEKTYAAKIVVYYSDNSVAWETATTNVEVAHTRTLSITDFALTSDATVDADGNNQFTSTFNVTVQNNGTLAQTAANVSVSITDADGNVLNGNATAWTPANSQTVFIVPGAYANDNAVLAIYRFNTGEEDAEWAELTKISDNFYSAELNNKAKFIIVRLRNSEDDGYVADNNGLNWNNKFNQSVDLIAGTHNCFTFKGWDDKYGDNHYFDYSVMSQLAVGVSTTMSVSVTTSALEGGVFTFKAKENVSNTVSTGSAAVTVNAAAPKFELALNSTAIENGDAVAYGIVKEATTKTFTISNTGNKLMEAPSISVPEGYEYERVAANGAEADWILFFYRNGTSLDADQGHFMATATDGKFIIENVNVPYEGVNFAVHKKNGNDWYDIYGYSSESEGGHLNTIAKATKLATATEASGWMTIPTGSYDFIWNANDLTLLAKPAGSILAGETADVNVTLKAEQGKKSGNLTFTYKVDASTNSTFDVALSGRSISADTWVEEFTAEIPATWTNNGWEWNSDRKAAYSGYSKGHELMTPRLAAENGEELTFDVIFPYSNEQLKVQYSTDKTNWNDVATYVSTANNQTFEGSFTAPAEGNYYLKFGDSNSRYVYVDNLCGFKLSIPEHDTEIAASSLPETGKQYNVYTATVTLKENAGKAEEVTANLYVDGEVKATETQTITANGSTVVTLTWEPQEVISEAVNAYVAVTGTGIDLTTEPVSLTIAEVYTLDEATSAATIDVVSNETVLLKRTFIAGWNTVCLPFAINDVEAFFGEGAKAYNFTGYNDDVLSFSTVDELTASYPYVVYVPAAITEPMKLQNITITSNNNEGFYSYSNGVYFRGTYAPIAAPGMEGKWGVTTDAHIAKGTESASIKGFRAYFEGIGDLTNARMSFTDLATGITQVIEPKPFGDNRVYNLNGQHVENAKKGLYIVNGKKVVIK